MPGWTNRGKAKFLEWFFRDPGSKPIHLFVALVTSATAPGPDTNVFSELTEIASGNGYDSGGQQINFTSTDWDYILEDDSNDLGEIRLRDIIWTASSSGPIPSSGNGARYAVILDDNATISSRQVLGYVDLGGDKQVAANNDLILQDTGLQATET